MKLTKSTDFALRLTIFLSKQTCNQTMPNIASTLAIPYHNLTKIVQQLSRAGYIETQQGKNGGIKLAKESHKISLKNIIDIINGPTELSSCLGHKESDCPLVYNCKLKETFSTLQVKINALFEEITIGEIINE